MSTTRRSRPPRLKYHRNAYLFVFASLRHAQHRLGRSVVHGPDDEHAHISGHELLEGIRELALDQFGLMTAVVFRRWGVHSTKDFGRIVFELVERGEMRKTDRDELDDFVDVYDFDDVFDRSYEIDVASAFSS